ncbi:MAG: putative aliphatic sulfonates transport permease protein SsuC [Lentisphaerae bacterium ADurb.Bin242]|nr:MAG: putative aliphatic sulfonates transport permease protein SsuC [Lentisphaerae bacterium ADurb.Bin242]
MNKHEFEQLQMIRNARTAAIGSTSIFLLLILGYAALTDFTGLLDPVLFPGWKVILPELVQSSGELFRGLLYSMRLLIPSLTAAILAGITAGLTVGLHPKVRLVLMPLFRAVNPVPPTMLIPYAIAVLPSFWLSSAAIIFLGVFWPVLMNTLHGIALLEPRWIDNARCLELSGRKLIFKVILPGAMPQIFAGIGSGLIFSFILLTVAEMFGAKAGMGFFVQYYADFAEYGKVIGGILFLSSVVIVIMTVFDFIQHKVLFWTRKR